MNKAWLSVFALCLLFSAVAAKAQTHQPVTAEEHVVLTTEYGDLVLAFYPEIAPQHVAQIIKLVKLGAYDGTHFFRVIPDFIVQLSDVNNRQTPLTSQQSKEVVSIPAEFSNTLKHEKGVLSMARWDDPDSATSSFSILLHDAPHLDAKYTIFGRLHSGGSVINKILAIPRDNEQPITRVTVKRAYVVSDLAAYFSQYPMDPAESIGDSNAEPPIITEMQTTGNNQVLITVAIMVVAIIVVSLLGFILYSRLSKSRMLSLLLVNVLIGGFVLFIILIPLGHDNTWLAISIFVGLFAMFRLMSRFESKQ